MKAVWGYGFVTDAPDGYQVVREVESIPILRAGGWHCEVTLKSQEEADIWVDHKARMIEEQELEKQRKVSASRRHSRERERRGHQAESRATRTATRQASLPASSTTHTSPGPGADPSWYGLEHPTMGRALTSDWTKVDQLKVYKQYRLTRFFEQQSTGLIWLRKDPTAARDREIPYHQPDPHHMVWKVRQAVGRDASAHSRRTATSSDSSASSSASSSESSYSRPRRK